MSNDLRLSILQSSKERDVIKISNSLQESKHQVNEEKESYFVIETISLATSQSLC